MKRSLVIILVICLSFTLGFAQEKTYIREYTYKASQKDSEEYAKKAALDQLKTDLLNEICSYVFNQYELTEIESKERDYRKQIKKKL